MVIFDEICLEMQKLGYTVVTAKPNSFPPKLVYVHLSDVGYKYETNMTVHMPVELAIEFVEDQLNIVDDVIELITISIERRLAINIPAAVGTFKFRKPEIILLGTAIKVALKCTYTKVIDI